MSDEPSSHSPRWTRARKVSTAVHSVVGLLLGLLFTPMVVGCSFNFARPFGPWVHLVAGAIGLGVLWHCTHSTCNRHPTAPRGVAIGLGCGAGVCLLVTCWAIWPRVDAQMAGVLFSIFVQAVGQPWVAMVAGRRGLLKNLGEIREGVGRTCATCGYDLSGTPEGWRCPECGDVRRYERRPGEGH